MNPPQQPPRNLRQQRLYNQLLSLQDHPNSLQEYRQWLALLLDEVSYLHQTLDSHLGLQLTMESPTTEVLSDAPDGHIPVETLPSSPQDTVPIPAELLSRFVDQLDALMESSKILVQAVLGDTMTSVNQDSSKSVEY